MKPLAVSIAGIVLAGVFLVRCPTCHGPLFTDCPGPTATDYSYGPVDADP